jgi:hypothetical protein
MGLNANATLHAGRVVLSFERPTKELVFTPEQAFFWGDQLSTLADQLRARGESTMLHNATAVHVGLRGVLVTLSFLGAVSTLTMTVLDAYTLSDELIVIAQKAEKRARGLHPTNKDVDSMEEALAGVGHHTITQYRPGALWTPSTTGSGVSLIQRLPMLSRLIRKPWY